MTRKVSARIVHNFARALGEKEENAPLLLASLSREGADTALLRFPEHRGRLLVQANILRERHLLDIPDIDGECFHTSGFEWGVTPPAGFENFQVVATDRDSKRSHLRVTFIAHDMATGWNSGHSKSIQKMPQDLERDPVLRMAVARALCPVACAYLERILRDRQGMTGYYRRHLRSVCENIFSLNHMVPNLSLKIRRVPHLQGEDAFKVLVTASFSATFEMAMYGRGTGEIFEGVDVQHNSSYFEIAGGVKTILNASANMPNGAAKRMLRIAKDLEASTAPQRRREQAKKDLEPKISPLPGAEVITLSDEDTGDSFTLEIQGPKTSLQKIARKSPLVAQWWRSHSGLIKPSITEIATKAISAHGDPSPGDIPLLIELSVPTLQKIARSRMSQFTDFAFDDAVIGLAELLECELGKKIV